MIRGVVAGDHRGYKEQAGSMRYTVWVFILLGGSVSSANWYCLKQQPQQSEATKPKPKRQGSGGTVSGTLRRVAKRVPFAAGVVIDWRVPLVELDARVVLREGPLELLACSPGTREHESILQVPAKPFHIFQAMGLIGLKPGQPVHYDAKKKSWLAASGDALSLRIEYDTSVGRCAVPCQWWFVDLKGQQFTGKMPVLQPINWVFAGSHTYEGKRFGADMEGTIACVVDFDSALIAVGARHSADNDQLWLGARPSAIPPIGTACKLLISAATKTNVEVNINPMGKLRYADKTIEIDDAVKLVQPTVPSRSGMRIMEIHPDAKTSKETIRACLKKLTSAGILAAMIQVDKE